MPVAALFVDPLGIYPHLVQPGLWWDEIRDARTYEGPHPVVAHPPCNLWVNMAAVNWKRYGRQKPAWYPGGDDGGCFASALASVRRWGGVLEHPAGSHAWPNHGLFAPFDLRGNVGEPISFGTWHSCSWTTDAMLLQGVEGQRYWVCEIWQSAYGHPARKRTWLLYCGKRPPFELNWAREPGTAQIGWFDRNKPTLSKRAASATPRAFAEELIRLAEWSQGV